MSFYLMPSIGPGTQCRHNLWYEIGLSITLSFILLSLSPTCTPSSLVPPPIISGTLQVFLVFRNVSTLCGPLWAFVVPEHLLPLLVLCLATAGNIQRLWERFPIKLQTLRIPECQCIYTSSLAKPLIKIYPSSATSPLLQSSEKYTRQDQVSFAFSSLQATNFSSLLGGRAGSFNPYMDQLLKIKTLAEEISHDTEDNLTTWGFLNQVIILICT